MSQETTAPPRRQRGPRVLALRQYVQPYRDPGAGRAGAAGGGAPEPVRTFHPRQGRVSGRHLDALHRRMPVHGLTVAQLRPGPLDLAELFGGAVPVVLEIGSGMGEATAAMAAADPTRGYLAVEVHLPGVANLLGLVEQAGLGNVRVAVGDALTLVGRHLPPQSLDAVHVFFPDPWPKSRHHKRRLIQPAHVALLRSRLVPGGLLHCATDSAGYARAMRAALAADPQLAPVCPGPVARPGYRPVTRFEARALDEGRAVTDLIVQRIGATPGT